jgi:catechol 2,3-dioxygenase-like lactoylglutathione lyase family enzyme
MIRILRIDHVAMHVSDVSKTAEFYTGLLGLPRVPFPIADEKGRMAFQAWQQSVGTPLPDGGLWVEVPGSQLHLISAEQAPGTTNPFGPHIAFEVEDLVEAKRTLDEQGVVYLEGSEGMPFRQIWIADPNGNTVELWQRA